MPVSSANACTDSNAADGWHCTASSKKNAKGAMDLAVGIFIPQNAASDRPTPLLTPGKRSSGAKVPFVHRATRRCFGSPARLGYGVPRHGMMPMDESEIDAVRALLSAKPRPMGWAERRARIDEVGTHWPVADDIALEEVDVDGIPGEWSIAPGSDPSRVLLFFHGGGYCSGSIRSHRRLVTEAGRAAGVRTLAVGYRLAPEHPFPAAFD